MKPEEIKVKVRYQDESGKNVRLVCSIFDRPGKDGKTTAHVSYEVIEGRKPMFFRGERPIMTLKSFSEWAFSVYRMDAETEKHPRYSKSIDIRGIMGFLAGAAEQLELFGLKIPDSVPRNENDIVRWLGETAIKTAADSINTPDLKEPFVQDSRVYWKSGDGKKYMPKDMTDAHLLNTFRFIVRQCLNEDCMEDSKGNSYIIDPETTEYQLVYERGDIERKIASECLKRKLIDRTKKAKI